MPIFLEYNDGFLREHMIELKERLVYWFRKLKPNRIITFDPWKKYEVNPDHIEIGRVASEAAVYSCFPLMYPQHLQEGLEPHQPDEVWYMIPMEHKPNRLVDISDNLERKLEAVLCHQSQVEMLADWFVSGADPANLTDDDKKQIREGLDTFLRMLSQGQAALSEGKVEFAEAFYAIKIGHGRFDNHWEMMQEMLGTDIGSIEFL
ncbi:MAG: PIG-L deacetylase family protein [Candidatus Hodarchaeales archaeon]